MPISIGEWRVRIGRFVRWNQESNRDLHVHVIQKTTSNAETSDSKDSSCGDTNSLKNNATSGSRPNNSGGKAEQHADSDREAGKRLGVGEVPQTAATRDVAGSTGSTTSGESDSECGRNDAPPTPKDDISAKSVNASSSNDVTSVRRQECCDATSASNSNGLLEGKNSTHIPSGPPSSATQTCSIKRSDLTPGPDTDAQGEKIRGQVLEKSRRRASMECRVENDVSADNVTPDTTELLLLRSGDVESNPGPNGLPGKAKFKEERDFDDILKKVAGGVVKDSEIDDLGKALGFDPTEIELYIKTNYRFHRVTSDGTLDMLRDWRKKQTSETEEHALKRALYDVGQLRLADDLVPSGPCVLRGKNTQPLTDNEIESVAAETKHHYIDTLCRIQADPLNQDTLLHFGNIFTNLTLIEEDIFDTHKDKPLKYEDLLKTKVNGLLARRFLVQAEGGAGKTTLCYKIAWDWAHGRGFDQFKLVVLVLLRKSQNKTVGEIVKAYISDSNRVTSDQLDEYILANPEKVFLVLDGLDEFDVDFSSLHQIVKIILYRLFKLGTVLITSRQWRVHEIRRVSELKMVYALIAIKGFSAENLAVYIKKFFHPDQSSSKDLRDFIEHNDVILENMAPFPIFVAMLCIMWKEFDGERRQAMSKLNTYSQLFDEMIRFLVDHYLSKDDKFHADKSMEERYDIVFHHLALIGKIAFQGLVERRLVFSEGTFHSCEESKEVACKVGVLTKERRSATIQERRQNFQLEASSVQFPHKLFQEYLSARYAASLHRSDATEYDKLMTDIIPKAKEFQYFLYFASNQQTELGLDIVTRLMAGKSGGDFLVDADEDINVDVDKDFTVGGDKDFTVGGDKDFIVDVAYESQDQSVAHRVANQLRTTDSTLLIDDGMSAHTVSGHLFLMEYQSKLNALEVARSCGHSISTKLVEFICSSSSLRSVVIGRDIGSTLPMTIHDVFYSELANQAKHSKIEKLKMIDTYLSNHRAAYLAQSICKMPKLKSLVLDHVQFHDDFYQTAASVGSSAAMTNLEISTLNLSERPAASGNLAQFICKMSHPQSLTLRCTEFHDDFYQTLESVGSSATNLEISSSNLSDHPAASGHLALFICKMSNLQSLSLFTCQFHDKFYQTAASLGSTATISVGCLQCFRPLHWLRETAATGSNHDVLPSLRDLSLDDSTLKFWQPSGTMFDSVKKVTITIKDGFDMDMTQRLHKLKGVTELIIQGAEFLTPRLAGDAQSVSQAILRAFPQLREVAFIRLSIGNADMRLILEYFRKAHNTHLRTFRMITCGTNEELDAFLHNLEKRFNVGIKHGRPGRL